MTTARQYLNTICQKLCGILAADPAVLKLPTAALHLLTVVLGYGDSCGVFTSICYAFTYKQLVSV